MNDIIHVLVITGDLSTFHDIENMLSKAKGNYLVNLVSNYDKAKSVIREADCHLLLVEQNLAHPGLDMLLQVMTPDIRKPFIVIADGDEDEFDLALKSGASDCLIKGQFNTPLLERSIKQTLEITKMIESLYEKEQKYRDLFQRSIDAIYFINASKQFIDVNPAMLSLLGYTKVEMLQMDLKDIFDSMERKETYRKIMSDEDLVRNFEVVLRSKDNSKIFCLINATSQKDIKNNIIGYLGVIHNISERKIMEQNQIKNEKLALTGRITRSIAHEVRNPLTNIKLAVGQMKDEFPNEDLDFYTDIISRSCERINNLITQLVQTTKPSELDLKYYNINQLLNESLQLVSDRMQLRQVKIIKDYKAGAISLKIDPQKIRTAILNILVNALDAVPEETGVVSVSTRLLEGRCVILIEDNGPGIEESALNNLFDAFYTGKSGGMGLGLTNTQNIIESHNGDIIVESEVGKGAKFIITFNQQVKSVQEATAS